MTHDRRMSKRAAWTLRLLSWLIIAATLAHVVYWRQALWLRGQFARLLVPDERDAALQAILAQPGLESLGDTELDYQRSVQIAQAKLTMPLVPGGRILVLHDGITNQSGRDIEGRHIYLVFDRDGKLFGKPMAHEVDPDFRNMAWQHVIDHFGRARFLVLAFRERRSPQAGAAGPDAARSDIYDLADKRQRKVLSLTYRPQLRKGMSLVPAESAAGAAACKLLHWTFFGPGASAKPDTLARFVWDEGLKTFVGPAKGPQSEWEVTFPSPYPGLPPLNESASPIDTATGS